MILVCIDCSCGLQRESIISELSEVTDRISSRSSANSLMISNTQLSFVRIVFQADLISMQCPKCQKVLGGAHWRNSQWHQRRPETPLYHFFNCCRDCGNVMENLHVETEEVREAAQFLCDMTDLLKADGRKLQLKFKEVFEGMTHYSAETRKTLSHSGCLYYLSQPHDPGNTLYTMALELLLPDLRLGVCNNWGEEKLGDLVEGLLWVWSPEFLKSKDFKKMKAQHIDISWLVKLAQPPPRKDLTMIGFVHGWFSSVFMLSRASGYTQVIKDWSEIPTFLQWSPQNCCPNAELRAWRLKRSQWLDDLVMSDSECEESPLPVSEGEDDEEDDAVLPADDDDGFAMDIDNEEAAYQAEYLDRLLLTEDEDEDEDL